MIPNRKDRRVFDAYKVAALAARDKKDKDDIATLRTEVLWRTDENE